MLPTSQLLDSPSMLSEYPYTAAACRAVIDVPGGGGTDENEEAKHGVVVGAARALKHSAIKSKESKGNRLNMMLDAKCAERESRAAFLPPLTFYSHHYFSGKIPQR
jgi:hypothetical protein